MKVDRGTLLKAIGFIVFLLIVLFVIRSSVIHEYLNKETLRAFVAQFGSVGPVAFIILLAATTVLLVPASLFTAVASVLFGPWLGSVYTIIGASLGSIGAFFIARTFARGFARKIAGNKLHDHDKKLEKHGFTTVFYMRVAFFPFTPLNYALGLTRVNFKDYFFATVLGIIPSTIIITFFVDEITSIHTWRDLLSLHMLYAVMLIAAFLILPIIIKKYFGKKEPTM